MLIFIQYNVVIFFKRCVIPDLKVMIDRSERLNNERREIILEAARLVFDMKGLRGATLRSIAKAAGCSTGAIYPYFKGKEQIYGALLDRSLTALHRYVIDGSPDARTRFLRFVTYYTENEADYALGLYLYDQGLPTGLGDELNTTLNTKLMATIHAIITGDPRTPAGPTEEALVFATLMGLLVTRASGRMKLFGAEFDHVCQSAFDRLNTSGIPFRN